jgi:hypothetical protein
LTTDIEEHMESRLNDIDQAIQRTNSNLEDLNYGVEASKAGLRDLEYLVTTKIYKTAEVRFAVVVELAMLLTSFARNLTMSLIERELTHRLCATYSLL